MPTQEYSVFEFIPAPWMEHGNCRGVDNRLFFPEVGESAEHAKAICNGSLGKKLKDGSVIPAGEPCPVKAECLEYAMTHPGRITGIWGGTSERERRTINHHKIMGTPVPLPKPKRKKKDTPQMARKHIPPHGSVARYKLELSVTGQPCEACTMAKWKQDHAKEQYPELAEVVRLISEVHEEHRG